MASNAQPPLPFVFQRRANTPSNISKPQRAPLKNKRWIVGLSKSINRQPLAGFAKTLLVTAKSSSTHKLSAPSYIPLRVKNYTSFKP
jgi:hypothetical protein